MTSERSLETTAPRTAFSVFHTHIGRQSPIWYLLDRSADKETAARRARNYAMDHGGYVCVKDAQGRIVYGTDPLALDSAISRGMNRHFTTVANGPAS